MTTLQRRPRSQTAAAGHPQVRQWIQIVDLPAVNLDQRYANALIAIAMNQCVREQERELSLAASQKEVDEIRARQVVPDVSDQESILEALASHTPPRWWPTRLERMTIRIEVQPDGETSMPYGPSVMDPNTADYGLNTFKTLVRGLLESAGVPFRGVIVIDINLSTTKQRMGGYRGYVEVGSAIQGRGGEDDPWVSDENAYLRKQHAQMFSGMLTMFGNSANVIGASAQAIQAMKPNVAEAGEETWKEKIIDLGASIAEVYLTKKAEEDPKEKDRKRLEDKRAEQRYPYEVDPAGPPADLLTGPTNSGWESGDDNEQQGDFQGVLVGEDDVLDDGVEIVDQEEEEEEEEQEEVDTSPSDPFAGKSEDEVMAMLEAYIDGHPNKAVIRKKGMKLVRKLM